jgi:hypothetical protein
MFADGHADPWAAMAQGAPAPAPAPAAPPPPLPPPRAPDGAPPPAALPRYLDLLRLLTGGAGGPAPAARRLSELERGAVRHADLKQALAANGLAAGARGKAELLARLEGLPLRDPTHVGAGASGAAEAPEALLAALRALGWAAHASESAAAAALARDGFYSYCPLPGVAVAGVAAAAGAAAAPMDEDVGAARSPEPEQEPAPAPAPAPEPEAPEAGEWPPPWLAASIAAVAAESRASGEAAGGAALVGRKVACVFVEEYDPGGGSGALARGARVGRVVEHVGAAHDEDACAPGCVQRHEYCYVRFNLPVRPPGGRARGNPAAPAPARVDLAVDLQPGLRAASLEALLALRGAQLADAWALLEPRVAEG